MIERTDSREATRTEARPVPTARAERRSLTASGLIRPEDVDRLARCPALDLWIVEIGQRQR